MCTGSSEEVQEPFELHRTPNVVYSYNVMHARVHVTPCMHTLIMLAVRSSVCLYQSV